MKEPANEVGLYPNWNLQFWSACLYVPYSRLTFEFIPFLHTHLHDSSSSFFIRFKLLLLLLFFFFSSRRFAKRLLLGVRICRFVTHVVVNKSICHRSFDLWLILRAWPHTPQAFFWKYHAMSASFCRRARKQCQNTTPGTPCPTLFEKCVGFFNVQHNSEQ